MKFERKLLLLFVAILMAALLFGWGRISFDEARDRAAADWRLFDPMQIKRIESKQAHLGEQAISACLETSGVTPDNFTLVLEIGTDGRVIRSWRQDDSRFVTCFQRLANEFFEFRGLDRSFFMAYEYVKYP